MIQRIQSVYLLVAAALGIVGLFIPVISSNMASANMLGASIQDGISAPSTLPVMLLNIVMILITVGVIFQFKNRPQQMKIAKIAAFAWLVVGGLAIWLGFQMKTVLETLDGATFSFGFAVAFPMISAVCCLLASKAIKKDEDLIKSVDRLR